jgi:hypothetical protein
MITRTKYAQVTGEVHIASILHCQVVAQNLKRDDVQQPLQAIHGLGNADRLGTQRDTLIALITQNDGLRLPRSDLRERRLDLGI